MMRRPRISVALPIIETLPRVISLSLGLGLIVGCATYPVSYAPRPDAVTGKLASVPKKFPFEVGYYISPADREQEIEVTLLNETNFLRYRPYRDIEQGIWTVLERVFQGVRRVNEDPEGGIATPGLLGVLIPKVRMEKVPIQVKVKSDLDDWGYTVWLTAHLHDPQGARVWTSEVRGTARRDRSKWSGPSVASVAESFRVAGVQAVEEALVALARSLVNSGELDLWARKASPAYAASPGSPAVATRSPAPRDPSPAAPSTASPPAPPEREAGGPASAGSGFLLRHTNLVLTNNHVVEGKTRITVGFPSGEEYSGRVVLRDRSNDLALVEAQGRPASGGGLVLAVNAEIKVGDTVHALGYPLGRDLSRQPSMVSGAISSVVGLGDDISRFRTTAPINPGNSGGPLVNQRGQVIGIAAAGLVRQAVEAIRFGIKASTAALILQQARATTAFDVVVTPASPPARSPAEVFEDVAPHVVLIEAR